jgi:CheY-like chemotaxis protein
MVALLCSPEEGPMPSPSVLPDSPGPILLVDDEVELMTAVSTLLRAEFGARVKATDDPGVAARWIDQERPGVLITDLRMPEHTGLDLLERSRQLWGPTPTILITAFPTDAVSRGARKGQFIYLPKPFDFRSLLDAIRELEATPPSSFSGAVAISALTDLIQLYAISGRTGNLAVKSGNLRGEIFFEQGQIVHAQTQHQEGFEGFCAILRWPQGSFAWYPRRTDRRSIDASVSELMLEAYRLQDEQANQAPSTRPPPPPAATIEPSASWGGWLEPLRFTQGFLAAALMDRGSGVLHATGDQSPASREMAVALGRLLEHQQALLQRLQLQDEIEDILITLGKQYHLIRPMRSRPGVFFYLTVDRARANLALARLTLAQAACATDTHALL